jgi:hypothetical protein
MGWLILLVYLCGLPLLSRFLQFSKDKNDSS